MEAYYKEYWDYLDETFYKDAIAYTTSNSRLWTFTNVKWAMMIMVAEELELC